MQNEPKQKKPGLLARLFERLDRALKNAADKKAEQGCCCSGECSTPAPEQQKRNDDRGGSCC